MWVDHFSRRKKKCIRYKHGEGEGAGEYDDDDDDMLLRNRTLDSSVHSGCESDSTNPQDSPLASRDFLHKNMSDSNDFSSPLSPLVDDKVEAGQQTQPLCLTGQQTQPLCLVTSSSPRPHPVKRPTPHTVDSFLSSPPPLRLQFPFPQSPLTLPYIGFPPFHHYPYPISPHAPRIKSESPYSPTS